MRIGYVIIDCDGRDGTAVAMAHVMHRLAERHEVHLFAANADGADLSRVTWHRVWAAPDPSVLRFRTFLANCSRKVRRLYQGGRESFDIVHSAGCNTVGANVYQVQNVQPAKRALLESQGQFAGGGRVRAIARHAYYRVTETAEKRLYRQRKNAGYGGRGGSVHFLPVSRGTARELTRYYGLGESDMTIVPNGVDLDRFSPALAATAGVRTRAALGIDPGEFVLLFVGGEWRRKGLHHAIDALPHVSAPHHTGVRLVIAGDDAARAEFAEQATRLGVRERVVFAGFVSETEDLYAAADVFVFPTYYEAYSLATLEAAASGLPVVAASTNGTEELIRPGRLNELGENGALVDRDGRTIAGLLSQLAADPPMMRRLGNRGRQIVEAEHTWDSIARRVEAVYEQIVAGAMVADQYGASNEEVTGQGLCPVEC
jgi:UDP-glucose:(heptosyl)LPS alpha-1,3-glucosyltransferase